MGKPVVHFEIGCRDREKTGAFYGALFDWTIQPMGSTSTIDSGGGRGIPGQITSLGHEPHHYTIFYVEVDNIAAHLEKVESLGGKRIVGPVRIPTGHFAWFSDPEGNVVGLLQRS
jgi:predicted enzyme related to lactoylglutathione lyase